MNIKIWNSFAALAFVGLACVLIGCQGDQPAFSQAKEDAIRHPQKDPNWKPATQADFQKEAQQIQEFRQKHANQPLQLANGH